MNSPLTQLTSLQQDVRALTGNTLANEMLDAIGEARRQQDHLLDLLSRATAHVRERGSIGPLGGFVPNYNDPATVLAHDIRVAMAKHGR